MSIRPSFALDFTSLYTALYRDEIFYPLIKARISDNDPNLSEDALKFPNAAEVDFWRSLGDKNNRKSKVRNWVSVRSLFFTILVVEREWRWGRVSPHSSQLMTELIGIYSRQALLISSLS